MSQFFTAFGIDWRLLLINVINFGVLLAGLYYFLYEPLLGMLEARRAKVQKGVHDAEAAAAALSQIEGERAGMLSKAGAEADEVLARARKAADEKAHAIRMASEAAAAASIKEAEAQAAALKAEAIEQSKKEVAKLVVLGMEKLSTQK
ncbi:MAG TPA: ATP synthase F0 subunit B [Candidatus Paceibacterota bacterium]|nr:ATP synthase F0 subunit B [Candidatus Paceibacterota bacterium]